MKIIDTHTHLPGRCLGAAPRSIAQIRREFEQAGLCGAWIMTVDGLLRDPGRHNDILADAVRGQLDFFTPFCSVNPHAGEKAAVRELDRAVDELGMKGLKLHPWLQAFSLTHPVVFPLLKHAGQRGLPVLLHDGTPPYSSPLQIAAVAETLPGTTFILGHAGLDDLYQDAMLACQRHANVHLCCCSLSSGFIGEIVRQCPVERLLFGSDGGFGRGLVEDAIAKLIVTGAPKAILKKIFLENPRRIIPPPP